MNRFVKFKSRLALSVVFLLTACAGPATRVILLPEGGGRQSAVEVKTATGVQLVTKPYQSAEVSQDGQVVLGDMDPLTVMDRYAGLLSGLPSPDEHFLLYFESGGAQLTAESQGLLPVILARARARKGGEIIVVGHTDRVGAMGANDALSLQRAKSVRDLLVTRGFSADLIEAVGRGERAPLVPTDDEIAEPKNRRAEILVR
jgi:outer membrane protein OmpA-like peptidoglycan-associated protein